MDDEQRHEFDQRRDLTQALDDRGIARINDEMDAIVASRPPEVENQDLLERALSGE